MKKLKLGTILFFALLLALAVWVTAIAIESNQRADALIQEVDILTDGMGR